MFSKKLFIFLTSIFFLFIFPSKVNAQVVINEINASEEWVELYKNTQEALSLDGCTMYFQDTKSQSKLLTVSDNFLGGENYKVIFTEKSILSNSDSDTVSLECPTFSIDPATYANNIGTKSYARIPNGTGSFLMTTQITQGTQNPDPTPEPTSSPSPTPTNSPTTAPTQVPTVSPTVKPIPTKSPTTKSTSTPTDKPTEESTFLQPEVLSLSTIESSPVSEIQEKSRSPILAIILITLGIGFLGYGGYLLYNQMHAENQKTP